MGDQGFEHVQLEVALAGRQLHRRVVAHHLNRHHRQAFALGGIDLARHDAAAWFVFRQHQLAEAAAGAAAQPADVVGDLHQTARQHGEGAMGRSQGFVARQGLKFVGSAAEGQADALGQPGGHRLTETGGGVEPGSHRRATDGQLLHLGQAQTQAVEAELQLGDIATELLAEAEGHGVLQMGAADLDDRGELLSAAAQGLDQALQGWDQLAMQRNRHRHMHRRREGVIAGLAEVDMVVGMHRALAAKHAASALDRPVGDHLVDVHVRLGAGTGLPDAQRKLGIEPACSHLFSRRHDRCLQRGLQPAHGTVHLGTGRLELAERPDDGQRHRLAVAEEVQGPLGLGAPVMIGRHGDAAEAVSLQPFGQSAARLLVAERVVSGNHQRDVTTSLLSSLKLTVVLLPLWGAIGMPVA